MDNFQTELRVLAAKTDVQRGLTQHAHTFHSVYCSYKSSSRSAIAYHRAPLNNFTARGLIWSGATERRARKIPSHSGGEFQR